MPQIESQEVGLPEDEPFETDVFDSIARHSCGKENGCEVFIFPNDIRIIIENDIFRLEYADYSKVELSPEEVFVLRRKTENCLEGDMSNEEQKEALGVIIRKIQSDAKKRIKESLDHIMVEEGEGKLKPYSEYTT